MSKLKKIKVLFVMPNLSAGGAEKVMSYIAQNLNKTRFEPILVVIGFEKDTVYDTNEVKTVYLNKPKVRNAIFKLSTLLIKEKPTIVFSSLSHLNLLLGLLSYLFPKIYFMGRETYVKGITTRKKKTLKLFFKNLLNKLGYRGLHLIICQSNDMKDDMIKTQGASENKIVIINNPVSKKFYPKTNIPSFQTGFQFLTVGRLAKQKGYDRILRILSKIEHPFNYLIIGDGPEKNNIEQLIETLDLKHKVRHIPFTRKISYYLSESHFYLQGSHVEGFPNALIESLAVGTPAIVFDAPGGINEIMIDGENGRVVHTEQEFESKLNESIQQISSFTPERVSRHVRNEFIAEKIILKYENIFYNMVNN